AEDRGIDEHRARLVERTHEVLALRQVDAGLAADRAVDHREQRGGHLHDVDAAVIDGRRKPRGVADDSAAGGDHEIASEHSPPRGESATAPRSRAGSRRRNRPRRTRPARVYSSGSCGFDTRPSIARANAGAPAGPADLRLAHDAYSENASSTASATWSISRPS